MEETNIGFVLTSALAPPLFLGEKREWLLQSYVIHDEANYRIQSPSPSLGFIERRCGQKVSRKVWKVWKEKEILSFIKGEVYSFNETGASKHLSINLLLSFI